jgi:DNA-binding winged helix-turn-helix (wHTH) protein/TolB-like protein
MATSAESVIYEFDIFRLDPGRRLLLGADDESIPLAPKVFDTLLYLVGNSGKVIGKDELMSAVWSDTFVEENNLNKNISALRRVLGENRGEHRFIATVPGKGYKFVADVRSVYNGGAVSAIGGSSPSVPEQPSKTPTVRSVFVASALAILLVVLITGSFFWPGPNPAADRPPRSIAILPFRPLVAGNRDEALELGMADTLISRFGSAREIVVRPLSSVRSFVNLDQDAVQAGRLLDVESVLDGNIQRWGDKIRVNVRLIRVVDGSVLWTETFDEKFTDIFVLQDAISTRVASALALQLSGDERTRLERRYTNSSDAYTFYIRGQYYVYKVTEPDIRKGIEYYEQAIQTDPKYAPAYAGIADAYRTLAIASFAPSKIVCPQAKAFAAKALGLDESLAEPHIVLGYISFLYDWDWGTAEKELQTAIRLSPNSSEAHRAYAHMLSNYGRHDEAIAEIRRASELAPMTLITLALESQFLFFAGRDNEAIVQAKRTMDFDPDFWVARNILGRVYISQKQFPDGISELTKATELSGTSTDPMMQLGYAFAISGDHKQALGMLKRLESLSAHTIVPFYNFAMIYNGLGEREKALTMLERSIEEREVQLAFIRIDKRWDDLRAEPRFAALVERMNFND